MERFDDSGKLIIPDKETEYQELERRGVHYAGNVHVHQAYCPHGHLLITEDNETFHDLPGIKLVMKGARGTECIYVSPFLNNREKSGGKIFELGDRLDVCCPVCDAVLPTLAPCDCQWNGEYILLALDREPNTRNGVCFCNIWGCPSGNVRLAGDVIADYRSNYEL